MTKLDVWIVNMARSQLIVQIVDKLKGDEEIKVCPDRVKVGQKGGEIQFEEEFPEEQALAFLKGFLEAIRMMERRA